MTMRLGLLGDTHGNRRWTLSALDRFADEGILDILQLGDFGVWNDSQGEKFLRKVNKRLGENGQTLRITLGNHECYPRVATAQPHPDHPGWLRLDGRYTAPFDHILIAPRVLRWEWEGVRFLSVGGANSINRYDLVEGIEWFAEEQISLGDQYRAIQDGAADVMLTHDCPAGVPLFAGGAESNGMWTAADVDYARHSREALRYITDVVQPKLLAHGHYHFLAEHFNEFEGYGGSYQMRTLGLDMDDSKNALAILEIPSLKTTLLH